MAYSKNHPLKISIMRTRSLYHGFLLVVSGILLLIACKSTEPASSIEEETITISTPVSPGDTETDVTIVPVPDDEVTIETPMTSEPEDTEISDEEMKLEESRESYTDDVASSAVRTTKSAMIKTDHAPSVTSAPARRGETAASGDPSTVVPPGKIQQPSAGQITAAEWNDLHNWEDWKNLLNNQDYNEMQTHWQLYPRTRYSVLVTNKYELPIQDAKVELLDKSGKVLWAAKTDNSGKAELWSDIKSREKSFDNVDARITTGGTSQLVEDIKTIEEGVEHITMDVACETAPLVDVLFAVDATGSMGDEILFLQSELKDVVKRSQTANNKIQLRMGAVFYRDSTDDYITKVQPLSTDLNETLTFIGAQSANGGGDYPEAVDAALDEALAQDWSEKAIARIIFLLLDAPPHHNPKTLVRIQEQVADAAREGIKIIPITASGINRQTEFLMKFMAIATNGTYVFITDHSGIGNAHLDPVVKDYEVEKLNNLLVRLLYNYTRSNGCNPNDQVAHGLSIYPNPASEYVDLTTEKPIRRLKILSNSGKIMDTRKDLKAGSNRIDLSGLVDGVYMIQCTMEDKEESLPVVLISGR